MSLDGDERSRFPSPAKVLEREEEVLTLDLGLEREYKILSAARRTLETGDHKLDLEALSDPEVPYAEARWQLQFSPGIGPKIADCISLFALDKPEAFPVDRWVKKAIEAEYAKEEIPFGDALVRWGQGRFGRNAGYASQLLFLSAYPGLNNP